MNRTGRAPPHPRRDRPGRHRLLVRAEQPADRTRATAHTPTARRTPSASSPTPPRPPETSGVGRILGSHVVLDLGEGTYALYARLRRGSLTVAVGEQVRTGEQVAECGNSGDSGDSGDSGNSGEPRLRFRLRAGADPDTRPRHPLLRRRASASGEPRDLRLPRPGTAVGLG
ncbi:peptidoglycan DD-metalloendopeptidase family protein [Streptomyces sp. MMG1533]|uniref:peptidoglycan DD-metalloendopeptidase family protein n=1 Tax=Streptomyces sp. MMG1533 TaxID=1415546 RepID=UPI002D21BAFF|nr:peptidoglycan DD-metalloendopeptidase family protein [Streptomyces sp. MMG1533]